MQAEKFDFYKSIVGILLTGISAFSAQYCIQPVIKEVAADFGRGADGAGVIMSASLLGMAAMLLVLVYISDKLPQKKCIIGSLLISVATTLTASVVTNYHIFLILRFFQGAILALIPVCTIAYARSHSKPEQAGFAVSMYICGMSLGGLSGRLIMGVLADCMPWRVALGGIGCVCLGLSLAEIWLLKADKPKLLAAAKNSSKHFPIFSKEGLPLVAICLFGFSFSDCFFIVFNFIPYVFSAPPYNFNHTLIGLLFLIQIFGSFSSFVAGRLHKRFGAYKISFCSLLLIACGALSTLHASVWMKVLGLIVINLGFFANQSMGSTMSSGISEEHKASCTAAYMFMYYMGASVVTAIGGYLYRAYGWSALIWTELTEVSCALVMLFWFIHLMKGRKS